MGQGRNILVRGSEKHRSVTLPKNIAYSDLRCDISNEIRTGETRNEKSGWLGLHGITYT